MRRVIEIEGLFDGTRTLENASVVMDDAEVVWVGRRGQAPKTPKGERSEIVEARGSFLLPGLVNCHAHLTLDGGVDFSAEARQPDALATLKAFRNARSALRSGVTTVRDVGANGTMVVELARAIERGVVEGPRVIAAARAITTTGGHAFEVGRAADGADDVRKAVREQLAAGATLIKLISTGGVLGEGAHPDVAQFTAEETAAAVAEAHKAGVRITTHAHAAAGIETAVAAGVDSVDHATLMDQKTVHLLKERDVAIVSTLSAIAAILRHADALDSGVVERTHRVASKHRESVRMAHRAGVRIAAGTDAGTPFNAHDRFADELDLLRDCGLSTEEALVAATRVAADVCGHPKAGRIEAGSWADLLFVDGDPLRDLGPVHAPRAVWVRGAPVS